MTKLIRFGAIAGALLLGASGCGGSKCNPVCGAGTVCNEEKAVCETPSSDGGAACSPACSGTTPYCLDAVCVQCEDSSQCSNTTVCNPADHTCVDSLPAPDAGPLASSCDPSRIVDIRDAGFQDGLFLSVGGDVRGRPNTTRPPTGCQTDPMADGLGTEIVHTFTMPVAGDLILTTDSAGTRLDTVVYNLDACTGGPAPASSRCSDDIDPASGNFSSSVQFGPRDAGTTQFIVVDGFNRAASVVDGGTGYVLGVGVRPVVGAAADCDKNILLNRCAAGLSCSVSTSKCETAAAPTIPAGGGFYNINANRIRIAVPGADTNADVVAYTIEFLNSGGTPIALNGQSSLSFLFSPPVQGKTAFEVVEDFDISGITVLAAATSLRISISDLAGLSSAPSTYSRAALPTIADGSPCKANGFSGACADGSFCSSTTNNCTVGGAPTLTDAGVYSVSSTSFVPRVVVGGTDPQGDVTDVVLRYVQADAGMVLETDGGVKEDTLELAEFLGTTTVTGVSGLDTATLSKATQVEVKLKDATGKSSSALLVGVTPLPIIGAGASCEVLAWTNDCSTAAPICRGGTPTCQTVSDSRAAACVDAEAITLATPGTPVERTFNIAPGQDVFPVACSGNTPSGGPEKIFSFTTTGARTDVMFSTDDVATTVNTLLYTTETCAAQVSLTSCSDDVDAESGNFRTQSIVRGFPAGTHYLFVDTWRAADQVGSGQVKLSVKVLPAISTANAACDPLLETNYCVRPLRCLPDATYTAYSCR
ncbi:MAG: hypothetical protein ACT4TC_26175 [Myxococcaceae bacterium]